MKKLFLIIAVFTVLIFFVSCEDAAEDPAVSDEAIVQLTLDRIDNNSGLSYDLFSTMNKTVPYDSVMKLLKASATKKIFADKISRASLDFFRKVVEDSSTPLVIDFIPQPFAGDAEITLKAMLTEEPGTAPPYPSLTEKYSSKLAAMLEQTDKDHKDWIIIEAFDNGKSKPQTFPAESVSLNYTKIKYLLTVPHIILMDPALSDEEVLETLDDVLAENGIPPVAVGLLLPAVQSFRSGAETTNTSPFDEALKAWLDTDVTPAINGGLHRDIIRRIQATIYLAGLHTLILEECPRTNQDMVSLSVLHARYRAALIVASSEMWED